MNHQEYARRYISDVCFWSIHRSEISSEMAEEYLEFVSVPSVWAWWVMEFRFRKIGVG